MKKLIVAAIFLANAAIADDLTIPNTFSAGTPAVAAEVNANFDAVEASVDDNAADIAANAASIASNAASIAQNAASLSNPATIKWLANGQVIGSFIDISSRLTVFDIGRMLTFEDYWVNFNTQSGQVSISGSGVAPENLFYSEPDCQGQAYIRTAWLLGNGLVFRSPFSGDPVRLYYIEAGSVLLENQTFQSNLSEVNAGCSNGESTNVDAYPAYPNDPATTGVFAEFFDLPLSIGHR